MNTKSGIINKQTVFLVVDDFEPMRTFTSSQLKLMGASIIVNASNGSEALRILRKQRVDIVLSDWNMPIMTGLQLLKIVRADEKLSGLPFIIITAEAEHRRIEEAIASGVSDLLIKPYTAAHLATRVERALSAGPRPSPLARSAVPGASAAALEPTAQGAHENGRRTILVVDDMQDNLLMLSRLFEEEYRIRIANNGEKALTICQSIDPPDLVLLDIMMPGMDGFEVARRMREHPGSETIPVIFVTSKTGEDLRIKGMELGAVDFVSKPIDPEVLKPRVRNFMRYVGLHKQLQASYDSMLELARLREDVECITRHDLKAPLAGMLGLVQSLADDKTMNINQVGQLRMAEETTLQLIDMINLSSEIFKIETGRFKLDAKAVKIEGILRRIVEFSRTTFAEKHLTITISVNTDLPIYEEVSTALGDATFCYSLLQNLIRNACEAAPDKSTVDVTLVDGDPLHILIKNKGAVPAEIREHFFDKFVTRGKEAGNGLGTYSAKLLAEAQNGSISLEVSDQENQTTIIVTLPRHADSDVIE
jgi:PleD family two-component response regulator/anti-sigma regulatory factor (Ser/Thr protein kinase)